MAEPNLFTQFGDQAGNVQQVFGGIINDLQTQIQQLQQQIIAMHNNPPPPPVIAGEPVPAQPAPREPKVAEPPIFDGSRKDVQSFLRAIELNFILAPSRFPPGDEVRRILFALAFIRGGTAGVWADNYSGAMLDQNTANPFTTYQQFKVAFEAAFGDSDRAQKARTDLATLKMKPGDTVEEFTTSFEALAIHSNLDEIALIEHYRRGLNPRIIEKIYSNSDGELPPDLEAWKRKARRLDNLYHELKSIQSAHSPPSVPSRPRQTTPRATGGVTTPSTTSAGPAPMDVDAHKKQREIRCYNCGELGHIARRCPNAQRARSVRATEIAEVVRSVLAEAPTASAKMEIKGEEPNADFQPSQQ